MAGVISRATHLKPDIRLAQAISEFVSDLPDEQKRIHRAQSNANPPDPSDVMRLTAEIDQKAAGKVGGRCYGPRMTNFLHAVQQFAAIGDVVVGGSQNILACGIWVIVRMSLLSVVNFSSYLDKLSTLLMNAGSSAPRYRLMGSLYPQSQRLQSQLSEYFIIIVRICHQILKFTQKPALQKFASSLSDADVKSFQSELEVRAKAISEEVHCLMAQRLGEEATNNQKSRSLTKQTWEFASAQQRLARHIQILNLCSQYDYETSWKQARKAGNTRLFLSNPDYATWKKTTTSCTLIYAGKLGSGKSVLMANIVDDVSLESIDDGVICAYFFCRYDIADSLRARTIIGAMARQILRTKPDPAGPAFDELTYSFDCDDIISLLERVLSSSSKIVFVLDGLDELEESEQTILIDYLRQMQTAFTLRLCISHRTGLDRLSDVLSNQLLDLKMTSIPENNPDIEAFVDCELERCVLAGDLLVSDPTLVLHIQQKLLEGSQDMFLWVKLQIQCLCTMKMKSDHAIRAALEDLPKDLSEIFLRILRSSAKENGHHTQGHILQLILAAIRPLTTEELREALAVTPGNTSWNPSRLPNDIMLALSCCGCLVLVDEEDLTLRLVHQSVKKFLLSKPKPTDFVPFTMNGAHSFMLRTLATYANYEVFDRTVAPKVRQSPHTLASQATTGIIASTLDPSSSIQRMMLSVLRARKTPDVDVMKVLMEAQQISSPRSVCQFRLLDYASSYWGYHVLGGKRMSKSTQDLLSRAVKLGSLDIDITFDEGRSLICLAAKEGKNQLLEFLLGLEDGKLYSSRLPSYYVNIMMKRDDRGRSPLSLAAGNGHTRTVLILLDHELALCNWKDDNGMSPLLWAAKQGHVQVIHRLVECHHGWLVDKDNEGRSPLSWAAECGHENVVKFLTQISTWYHGNGDIDHYGRTPLSRAAENGNIGVVQLLLAVGDTNIEVVDKTGQTPMGWANANGHTAVVDAIQARLLELSG